MQRSLWHRLRAWVLLILLLALSLAVLLARGGEGLDGVRAAVLERTAWAEARLDGPKDYFRVRRENRRLRRELFGLASDVARSREAALENRRLRHLLGFQDTTAYRVRAARIIGKSLGENLFTLDVGRRDGVEPGMAVLDEQGILGSVLLASDRYARVLPYQHTQFFVPGKVQPMGAQGIVRWMGDRPNVLTMEQVVRTEAVQPGQRVVTSSFSGVFPAGWPIGTVDSVRALAGRNEVLLYLTPSARLDRAEHAFVVLQKPEAEREALEAEARRLLSDGE